MKLLMILQTALIIFAATLSGAAQSGRIKKIVPQEAKQQITDLDKKGRTNVDNKQLIKDVQYGVELYLAGNYQDAEEVLIEVIETDRQIRHAWFYLGLVYARTDRSESAERAFAVAEELPQMRSTAENSGVTPLQILSLPQPLYTKSARRSLISGTVKLAVEFGADGKIAFVCPITKFNSSLTQTAIRAAWTIKFKPALKDGKPISTVKSLLYTFGIE